MEIPVRELVYLLDVNPLSFCRLSTLESTTITTPEGVPNLVESRRVRDACLYSARGPEIIDTDNRKVYVQTLPTC